MKVYNLIIALCIFFNISLLTGQTVVTTYAGSGGGYEDGDTANAKFRAPFGMCIDANDNLYIADADNHCIRKITAAGIVITYAGTGVAGYADGIATLAQFNSPSDICLDSDGNLYVSDFANQRIRKIDFDGNVTTVAGNGNEGYNDGNAVNAEFDYPRGIVIDSDGNLFIGDSWNHRIRKIDLINSIVTTFAGGGLNMGVSSEGDFVDGTDTSARFHTPSGLAIDQSNNIYVADAYNHRIRMITPDGLVSTIAGSGSTGPGNGGYINGDALSSLLNTPTELFVTTDGLIYIGDTFNNVVRLLSGWMLSTVAGNTNSGYVDGDAAIAEFKYTRGIVADASGDHLYVCDYNNKRIRKIWLHAITSIEDDIEYAELIISPNPAHNKFQIEIESPGAGENFVLQLGDMNGRLIMEQHLFSAEHLIVDITSIPKGVYVVRLIGNEVIGVKRLIIE